MIEWSSTYNKILRTRVDVYRARLFYELALFLVILNDSKIINNQTQ